MPLSTKITRYATTPRKIAWISAAIGSTFFLLFITLSLTIVTHKRALLHDRLMVTMHSYMLNTLYDLKTTLTPLLPYIQQSCPQVNHELTSQAALNRHLNMILLVRNGNAYCSSATGAVSLDVNVLSPHTYQNKETDITLVPDTSAHPRGPSLVLWLKQPGKNKNGILATLNLDFMPSFLLAYRYQEIQGVALVTGDKALTTWGNQVIPATDLPSHPLRQFTVSGYPLSFFLYGDTLPVGDIYLMLLVGLLLAISVGSGCFLLLTTQYRPGRSILMAIKRGQFHVVYQPIIDAITGRTYGIEALLRWTHPIRGQISPEIFIHQAEEQNLIIPLTRHLFELVSQDAHRLRHFTPTGLRIGLNLSPHHLLAASFYSDVNIWLAAMPPAHFNYVFEITERTMVSEKNAAEIFDWIHQQNIQIAIDDFGTGHSALIYLEKFSFDYLKIDRDFIQSIGSETEATTVLDAVLNLAKQLNLKTVAEGVATREQATWLISRHVTCLQGYLFSYPLNIQKLIAYFQKEQGTLS